MTQIEDTNDFDLTTWSREKGQPSFPSDSDGAPLRKKRIYLVSGHIHRFDAALISQRAGNCGDTMESYRRFSAFRVSVN